jgi:dTDP-4-amino-4,6-dideoxygalactose transaminase
MQAHRIERAPQFYDTVLNLPCSVSLTPDQIAEVVALVEAADPRRQATPA